LGQITAENQVKPWSVTQNQAKRINDIAFPWLIRDQGVEGFSVYRIWSCSLKATMHLIHYLLQVSLQVRTQLRAICPTSQPWCPPYIV